MVYRSRLSYTTPGPPKGTNRRSPSQIPSPRASVSDGCGCKGQKCKKKQKDVYVWTVPYSHFHRTPMPSGRSPTGSREGDRRLVWGWYILLFVDDILWDQVRTGVPSKEDTDWGAEFKEPFVGFITKALEVTCYIKYLKYDTGKDLWCSTKMGSPLCGLPQHIALLDMFRTKL